MGNAGILCRYRHNIPYADILEMPIKFLSDSMPDPMSGTVINYRHLFQSTKPFDSIFVIGILEHHIILKDGTITIAKLMWRFLLHCFSNLYIETRHFYVRMTKPFRYSRKWQSCLIQVHCPRSSEKM